MRDESSINPGPLDRELFLAVLEQPVAERAAFLAAQCGDDTARRERVAALLAEHQVEDSFLETPAVVRSAESASTAGGTQVLSTNAQFIGVEPGERIGRYKLLQQIGEGGCGTVYMAEQEEPVRRRVALKIIKLGMDTKGVIARFEAERQALAMMDHPNIAKVLDAGATETGRPYFVMELVRGIKVTEYADQNNLPTDERLKLFMQVCNAIQHAHQKGIIHRDIKPSNILVTLHDGVPVPKVIDFGIAKAIEQKLTDKTLFTQFQAFIGTPAYMSPEQAEMSGLDIDTRSDIYSLGVLLYEILTGQTPFDPEALISNGIDACRRTIREQEPARPSTKLATMLAADLTTTAQQRRTEAARLIHLMRGDLDWIVMKCLEKDRSRRYESASGLATDVQRYLGNEAVLARPPSNVYRLQKFLRKHRGPVAAAAAIALLLVIGATVSVLLAIRASRAEDAATTLAQNWEQAADLARREGQASQLNEYVADIGLAQQALREGNFAKAVQLLQKHAPSGRQDLRGFEWRHLWALSAGDPHLSLPRQSEPIISLALSPDGGQVAISTRDAITVWNQATGSRTVRIPLRPASASEGGSSPPGSGGERRAGRSPRFAFWGYDSVGFANEGKVLVAASRGGLRRWRTSDWTELEALPGLTGPIAITPDGRWLAAFKRAGPGSDGAAVLLSTATWETVRQLADARDYLALAPDGSRLAADSLEGIRVWNLLDPDDPAIQLAGSTNYFSRGMVMGHLSDRVIAFSPDGRLIAAPRNTPTERGVFVVNLWDATTGKEAGTLPTAPEQIEHKGVISGLVFSPDGHFLATASMDHSIRLWDVALRRRVDTWEGHLNEVWTLAYTPDGERLISGAKDGSVNMWPTERAPETSRLAGLGAPLGFSQEGRTLATLTSEGEVLLINADTRDVLRRFPLDRLRSRYGPGRDRWGMAISADLGTLAQVAGEGAVRIWNTTTGDSHEVTTGDRPLDGIHLSPNGRTLIGLSRGQIVVRHDLGSGQSTRWEVPARLVAFSPDGRWVLTLPFEGLPQLWRADDFSAHVTLESPDGAEFFTAVFSPDGARVAVTQDDHAIGLWDTAKGEFLGTFSGHMQPAFSLAFSPDGRTLASSSADSTLRLWNVATRQELITDRRLGTSLSHLNFSPDGQLLVGRYTENGEEVLRLMFAPQVSEGELLSRGPAPAPSVN